MSRCGSVVYKEVVLGTVLEMLRPSWIDVSAPMSYFRVTSSLSQFRV